MLLSHKGEQLRDLLPEVAKLVKTAFTIPVRVKTYLSNHGTSAVESHSALHGHKVLVRRLISKSSQTILFGDGCFKKHISDLEVALVFILGIVNLSTL